MNLSELKVSLPFFSFLLFLVYIRLHFFSSSSIASDVESGDASHDEKIYEDPTPAPPQPSVLAKEVEKVDPHPIDGSWYEPKNLYIIVRYKTVPTIKAIYMNGVYHDIHAAQAGKVGTKDHDDMRKVYAAAKQFPNGQ